MYSIQQLEQDEDQYQYRVSKVPIPCPNKGGGGLFDRTKHVIIKEKFILATEHVNVETRSAPRV